MGSSGLTPPEPAGETRLRRLLLLCFLAGYLLCGPLWHETSRVHREPLPDLPIHRDEQFHFDLPVIVRVIDVRPDAGAGAATVAALGEQLAAELRDRLNEQSTEQHNPTRIHWRVSAGATDALRTAASKQSLAELDDALAQLSSAETTATNASLPHWQLLVLVGEDGQALPERWVLGRHRHAFLALSQSRSTEPATRRAHMEQAAVLLHSLVQAQWCATLPTATGSSSVENGGRSVGAASDVGVCAASRSLSQRLSFTLLNTEDSSSPLAGSSPSVSWSWDFRRIEQAYLARFIQMVRPFVTFSTDSNVAHYTRLSDAQPTVAKKPTAAVAEGEVLGRLPQPLGSHIEQHIAAADAAATAADSAAVTAAGAPGVSPHVLASSSLRDIIGTVGGWNLASPLVSSSLEMLAYIPPREQRPLLFQFPALASTSAGQTTPGKRKGRSLKTAALFVPRFGGVAVLNDLPTACDTSSELGAGVCDLPDAAVREMMQVFVEQIRQTMGLSLDVSSLCPSCGPDAVTLLPSPSTGVSQWELDLLAWRLVRLNLAEALALLHSLVQLLDNVPHMPVSVEIQQLVEESLRQHARTLELLHSGKPDWSGAGQASQAAVAAAHRAFFHPQMLPALYFPDEHLYAVYLPLFLPVTVPLVSGLAAWFAAWKKQRSKAAAAAAAAAAAVQAGSAAIARASS